MSRDRDDEVDVAAALCTDPSHADLLAKFEQMAAQIVALTQQVQALTQCEAVHAAENAALRAKVEELEARLKKDSSNSSRPPSSDPPWHKRERPRAPSGKKPGGQPGHEGTTRQMFDTSAVTNTLEHRPTACTCCGSTDLVASGEEPYRHQIVEIPKIQPQIDEHRLFAMRCKKCGSRVVAPLPLGVPTDHSGPMLKATVAYLTGVGRMSKRDTQTVLKGLLGVDLGTGTIPAIERRVSRALDWSYREAQRALREGVLAHVDETSWREAGRLAWLWGMTDKVIAVFRIDRRRNRKAYRRLFAGLFHGFLVADRFAVYDNHPHDKRQSCDAHLLRDFEGFVAGPRRGRIFGRAGLRILHRLFGLWHRFQEGRFDHAALTMKMESVRLRLVALLTGAKDHAYAKARRFAAHLLPRVDAVFGFLRCKLAEPTNNAAERIMRRGVLWRKSSYGTASAAGSRFVERILTVSESLRAQGRDILAFLVESIIAHATGRPPPSLLPIPAK